MEDSIETAIHDSLDPNTTQDKRVRALETLLKAKQADNCWQICLEKLFKTTKVEVQFWCIQTLNELINSSSWTSLYTPVRLFIRDSLTFYYFGVHVEEDWNGTGDTIESWKQWRSLFPETFLEANVPNFVRNKCAQLFSSLIAQEYPHSWPSIFRRLFSILPDVGETRKQNIGSSDIELLYRFLLVLYCLDEEFISLSAIQRSGQIGTRLRDGMRSDCIQQIVNLAIQITHSYHTTSDSRLEELCCLSLDICRRFVEWIDISLVTDSVFISTVFSMMIQPKRQCARSVASRIFSEIVSKKMSLEKKYQLLCSLNLDEFLTQWSTILSDHLLTSNYSIEQEASSIGEYLEQLGYQSFPIEMVKLVNTIASEALELVKASQSNLSSFVDISKVYGWIRRCLPVMIKCFQLQDDKIYRDTWEFLMIYINNYRNEVDDVGCILSILWEQVIWIDQQNLTEDQRNQFQQQRERLVILFKNICRVYPSLAMETIRSHLEGVSQRQEWDLQTLEEIECIYSFTNAFVELNHKTKEWDPLVFRVVSVLPKLEWFSTLNDPYIRFWIMEQLFSAYDDLLSHSVSVIESDMSLVYSIIVYLMDERGLRNPYSFKLRNKAASSLLKIARPLRQILATHFFQVLMSNLESIIVQTSQNIHIPQMMDLTRTDDISLTEKLSLIQVVGIVLGGYWESGFCRECETILENWLTRLITTLESCIAAQNVSLGCYVLEALVCIAKGFNTLDDKQERENNKTAYNDSSESLEAMQETNKVQQNWSIQSTNSPVQNLTNCWKGSFPVVYQFLKTYGSLSATKEKCLIFLHRMVDTLGAEALLFIQSCCLELISLHSNAVELTEIFLLVNQIVVKLKASARSFLCEIIPPLFKSISNYFQPNNMEYLQFLQDPLHFRSEIWRENVELLKTFHLFLYHLVCQHLEDILLLPNHQPFLLFCLGMLVNTVSSDTVDLHWTECKYAWVVVGKLVLRPDADTLYLDSHYTLRQWIVQTFVPLSILLLLYRLDWKKPNKAQLGVVEEIVSFYMACKACPNMNPNWQTCFEHSLSKWPQIPSQLCQELFLICQQQQDKKSLYTLLTERLSKD